ncbi:MAG: hypothetical protein ACYSX0_05240 [Planctomycetota bacterium]|jgi:hypothetical protein
MGNGKALLLPLLACAAIAWPFAPASAQQGNPPKWGSDLNKALKEAKEKERPLLIYVFDDV